MRKWVAAFAGGMLVAVLGAFLAVQGLDRADKWASVLGLFAGLAGLGLAAAGAAGARRQPGGQSITDATIGAGVAQVRGVRGSVTIGPGVAPAAPPAAPAPAPSVSADNGGTGQSVRRSSAAGPVRQVDDVGGDLELDR